METGWTISQTKQKIQIGDVSASQKQDFTLPVLCFIKNITIVRKLFAYSYALG